MYPIAFFIIAVILAVIHLLTSKKKNTFPRIVEILLAYLIPISIGLSGLTGYIAHTFYGPQVARLIGWPANNPFQFEIGVFNLSIAIAAFVSIWMRKGFWLATTLITSIFLLGAAYGHVVQMAKGDYAPYNTGAFVYIGDIAFPIVYLILSFIYAFQNHFFKENPKH